MKKSFLAVLCLAPVAFSTPDTGPAPHEAVLTGVRALRRNDLRAFLESTMTEGQVRALRDQWNAMREEEPDAAEAAQFEAAMKKLTAAGAEDALMAELAPKLAEMRPQVDMLIGMFQGMGQSVLAQDQTMSDAEKQRAAVILGAMGKTLSENDITSEQSARKTVEILCRTARKLRLGTLEEAQELSFDELLARGNTGVGGLKQIMGVYGLPVDTWLDSVRAETVTESRDQAIVRISYEVLGVRESMDAEMVRIDGRWLRKEAVELEIPATR